MQLTTNITLVLNDMNIDIRIRLLDLIIVYTMLSTLRIFNDLNQREYKDQ